MSSKVYFLPWKDRAQFPQWIRTTGAYDRVTAHEFVALKIHFGEEGNVGYIRPEMIKPVIADIKEKSAWPFLTDANTIYVGQRADAYHHLIVAESHGFTLSNCGCPIIIADGLRGNSSVGVPVNLKHFKTVNIANAVHYADSLICFNHFKGHEISGFGGALKNIGMGCGSRAGKYAMHDTLKPKVNLDACIACGQCLKWCSAGALKLAGKKISLDAAVCVGCGECILSCPQKVFHIPWDASASAVQEKIAEYAYGVINKKPHFSINFLNHITQFCDCYPSQAGPLIEDIGIIAGADPVAVDQASADMVNKKFGGDFWRNLFPEIDWTVQLDYAEKLGIGSRTYELVEP
ncbi:MAG: DUF362 domain-containing protein [Elusimicrobia bacterium]|nr:DUF362 domain-containing protein [Elusimicrobiota bacterium]